MTALILAAGMGIRMGPRGKLMPKGLLQLGDATLIEENIDTLRRWGADRVVMVTGHLADQYEVLFAKAPGIELIYNPLYATTGSLRSLQIGLSACIGPVVIVESDLTFAPEALDPIDPATSRATLSGKTGSGDEQYVWAEPVEGRGTLFRHISKDPKAERGHWYGEHVGITGLSADAVSRLRRIADATLMRNPEAHYEPCLISLAREVDIDCVRIDGLAWAEIDDEVMFDRVQAEVYPKVQAARFAAGWAS